MRKIAVLAAILIFGAASAGFGQNLTLSQVKKIAAAAEAEAASNNWRVIIAIVDAAGHLLYLQRDENAQLASLEIAQAKARTAALYRRPTKVFADFLAEGRQTPHFLPNVMPLEGGLPILLDGKVVGAIGVSGVTAQQDGQIAAAGVAALGQ